jgi:outer membrane lipoprotein-sorting protein
MKSFILSVLFSFLIAGITSGQQDPEAKKILDEVAAKTKTYKTIQSDFKLSVINRPENKTSDSEGKIKIKGDKYQMDMLGSKIYFDGKTMWNYNPDVKEVTITEPDKNDSDFMDNPAKIFTWYNRDFKYQFIKKFEKDGRNFYEIYLFPKNLNQPYVRFNVIINADTDQISSITSVGKEGTDYKIELSNIITDKPLDDSIFEFDPSKHKKVEVIDMRM